MSNEDLKTKIKNLITGGRMSEALELMHKCAEDTDRDLENSLLMQLASYNALRRNRLDGIITEGDYGVRMARIRSALLHYLDELPECREMSEPLQTKVQPPTDTASQDMAVKRVILFLTANPVDTAQLRLSAELRKVKDTLKMTQLAHHFDLISEPAVNVLTITGAMQDNNPDIVHFSGHGAGDQGVLVEDNSGETIIFPNAGLNILFRAFKEKVKCVVLNACYSRVQAELISKHDMFVVGMSDAIEDEAAISFAAGFYQSLGYGRSYEDAFDMALVTISPHLDSADLPELWFGGKLLKGA